MRDLTLVLPHFQNLGMFAEQQKVWSSYPESLRRRLHVVVVDDCSPKGHRLSAKAVVVSGLGSLRMYRLTEKKRWNWLACRNLGAKVAQDGFLLLTDIDHVLPVETLERLVRGPLQTTAAYRFKRVDAPRPWPYVLSECSDYKMHNDTWLMTRELFFSPQIFGYDERLSGCYGTSGEFRDRVMATASAHIIINDVMVRYPREIIPDASTHPSVYTRKNDPKNDGLLADLKLRRSRIKNWKPLHGLVGCEEIYASEAVPC